MGFKQWLTSSKADRKAEYVRRETERKAKLAGRMQAIDESSAEQTEKREAEYAERSAELKAEMRAGVAQMKQGLRKMRGRR